MRLLLLSVFLHYYLLAIILNTRTRTDSFEAPSLSTRTLWSIISSSVLTLFACTYSAIHLNIPSPKDSPGGILLRRLGIMIVALIAPELIITWAMRQWLSARQVTRQFKESEQPDDHGLIAAIVGQLEHVEGEDHDSTFKKLFKDYFSEQSEDYTWTQTHSFFVLMGGFMLYVDEKPYHTLQPDEVLKLIRDRCIDAPNLTAKQIHDKSKGNAISKGLIILQVAWFVMQLITRAIYRLKATQLEMGTLAFAVLSFITYGLWWDKPFDVQCPHPVYWKSTESRPENHIDFNEKDQLATLGILAPVFRPIVEMIGWGDIPTSRKPQVPAFDGSIKLKGLDRVVPPLAGLLISTIFGAIHRMAWFFAFPTNQKQELWSMSVVAITFTPWFSRLLLLTGILVPSIVQFVFSLIFLLMVILYITTRTVLLVFMFTTLRNLPPDAYEAVLWTNWIPHLA
ncbi:hypothetical protein BDR04DRAFT_1144437 [Suillus decipiens]|nr:hypothetical protein BDR04DRAFT_1144437 [Suillus decipiens]